MAYGSKGMGHPSAGGKCCHTPQFNSNVKGNPGRQGPKLGGKGGR